MSSYREMTSLLKELALVLYWLALCHICAFVHKSRHVRSIWRWVIPSSDIPGVLPISPCAENPANFPVIKKEKLFFSLESWALGFILYLHVTGCDCTLEWSLESTLVQPSLGCLLFILDTMTTAGQSLPIFKFLNVACDKNED